MAFYSKKNLSVGEEIFASYGDSSWFSARNIPYRHQDISEIPLISAEELRESGHCLTDIAVKQSSIPLAGKGVFAKKNFKKGDVINISPVIPLPKHTIDATSHSSVLINYCIVSKQDNVDVALLPIGLGSMMNQ